MPYSYQIPTAVVIAKLDRNLELIDLVSLDEPQFRPHVMTEYFWRGWESYGRPQWITFNGRGFDLPVMELAAFRYGLSVPNWFKNDSNSYSQPRNRFNVTSHFDFARVLYQLRRHLVSRRPRSAGPHARQAGKMDIKASKCKNYSMQAS